MARWKAEGRGEDKGRKDTARLLNTKNWHSEARYGSVWKEKMGKVRPNNRLKSQRQKMQLNFKKYFCDPLVYQYVVSIKLRAFWSHSQNCEERPSASSCLSVCPRRTTRLQLEEFSLNLTGDDTSKISRENWNFVQIWTGTLHEDLYILLTISRSILLEMRNVSDKSCREHQNTHFVFSNFFSKILPFMR